MAKARVTFSDVNVTITVPVGTRVIEVSERVGSYVPYNCREGDCGTCLFQVVSGGENLSRPTDYETRALFAKLREVVDGWRNAATLDAMQAAIARDAYAAKPCRLACQAQVFGDCVLAPV